MILCNVGEVYIPEKEKYKSASTHARALILSKNVLLFLVHGLHLSFETYYEVNIEQLSYSSIHNTIHQFCYAQVIWCINFRVWSYLCMQTQLCFFLKKPFSSLIVFSIRNISSILQILSDADNINL